MAAANPVLLHSLNLRGSFDDQLYAIKADLEDSECTAFFLQDLGAMGPDGHPRLRAALEDHQILINSHPQNKSRSVALIINKTWKIVGPVQRDEAGCVVATTVEKHGSRIFLASVYMPTALTIYGSTMTKKEKRSNDRNGGEVAQEEAYNAYTALQEWCEKEPYWVVGGDFNEVRNDKLDRIRKGNYRSPKHKFLEEFLTNTHGQDVWRHLFPNIPGFTYTNSRESFSRLDYFIACPLLADRDKTMTISNWCHKKDHARITFTSTIPEKRFSPTQGPKDDIPRPRLTGLKKDKLCELKQVCNEALGALWDHDFGNQDPEPNVISKLMAKLLVDSAISVTGRIQPPKPRIDRKSAKLIAEIRTIEKCRDIIRSFVLKEVQKELEKETFELLEKLLDRLSRMGLSSIPTTMDLHTLWAWAEKEALQDIAVLQEYARIRKQDIRNKERHDLQKMFCNPAKRGEWLKYYFGKPLSTTPKFVIDPSTGSQIFDPDKMKAMYLQEGTLSLRAAHPCPPLHDEKEHSPPPPIPSEDRRESAKEKPSSLPAWWSQMYDRNAKQIDPETWEGLMDRVSTEELRQTIQKCGKGKAAGYDGVSIDLLLILTEDGPPEGNICLKILAWLISEAFVQGKSLESWRKAVISMIPKRKEDGSFTNLIREMRPISVLQEFGKLASKILADRLGKILLKDPTILSNAQRAFLRDGSVRQCIGTLVNVFEDFKDKQKSDQASRLFFLAYDQVKAYDSVQGFSIRASLERFNLPDDFISYVLSGLEEASSTFKTFHGLTQEFPITTSVRQGDPLSPLVYIFITDALHEGLRKNPIYGCKTGYKFSNNQKIRVSSLGYADDTCICAESWEDIWMMHEWVRDFCFYHKFQLNPNKCKYFISDQSDQDNRWLWSVDGLSKLHPLPPSTPFRYLGVWLTLSLDWGEQIQMLNRMVWDWRRRAIIGQIDPAQLKCSVTEFLLPKMELGLLFADVSERMCNAWTATIIYTIARKMSTVATLNRAGFCFLSGIPHLWLRTQTIRVTELLVNLNTSVCAIGSTTRARLCRLTNPTSSQPRQVLEYYKKVGINKRPHNRIAVVLQNLQKVDAHIIATDAETELPAINDAEQTSRDLQRTLESISDGKLSLQAYTDGSTHPHKGCNSGVGIYVTDEEHNEIWKGGLHIRSDKNNFTAEVAAAATVINALPENATCTLWIDSMATIQALQKGALLSERRRVRSAGRLWLNWARPFLGSPHIQLRHVRSHTGGIGPTERGNEIADSFANSYRLQGEKAPPDPIHWKWEESFCLLEAERLVQGDIRAWAKKVEEESLLKDWSKSKLQSKWIKKNQKQIKKMVEEVWKWSIEAGDGGAWIYFIFAVSNWLPTRRRTGKRKEKSRVLENPYRRQCLLCQSGEVEDLEHLMRCPALLNELNAMCSTVKSVLTKFGLGETVSISRGDKIREDWFFRARYDFPEPPVRSAIASSDLSHLLDYWITTNGTKLAYHRFVKAVQERLRQSEASTLAKSWILPKSLLILLADGLSLSVEATTNALLHSDVFEEWWSADSIDQAFGAKPDWSKQSFLGRNIFVNPIGQEPQKLLCDIIAKALDQLKAAAPTRIVAIIPKLSEPNGGLAYCKAKEAKFMEIARFKGIPEFDPTDPLNRPQFCRSEVELSLFLGVNKDSIARDPILWDRFTENLKHWATTNGCCLSIPEHTNALFKERTVMDCAPRWRRRAQHIRGTSLFRFYNSIEPEGMHPVGLPPIEGISRINSWPKTLGFLGLLPFQLRQELKNRTNGTDAATYLSKSIFWAGYQIWKTRCEQVRKVTQVVPKPQAELLCQNPFHYLKRTDNLNSLRIGTCSCYRAYVPRLPNRDIRDWLLPVPHIPDVYPDPSEDAGIGDWLSGPQLDVYNRQRKAKKKASILTEEESGLDMKYVQNGINLSSAQNFHSELRYDNGCCEPSLRKEHASSIHNEVRQGSGCESSSRIKHLATHTYTTTDRLVQDLSSLEMPQLTVEELCELPPDILLLIDDPDRVSNILPSSESQEEKAIKTVFRRRKRRKKNS